MKSRSFRKLMYHFCEALGEAGTHSSHKNERRNRDSFELHWQLIDRYLPNAIKLLAKNSELSLEQFSHTVFIWNNICDELLFNPIITLGSDDEIDEGYIAHCLIPLLVAQIAFISSADGKNTETIFYHIEKFLLGHYVAYDGPDKYCFYTAARKYLREYVKSLNLDCTDPIVAIIKSIGSIKPNSHLRAITIKQHFTLSKQLVRENSSIHKSSYDDWDVNLDKFETAYIAISAILYFEKKTHLSMNLLAQYWDFYQNFDDNTDKLFSALAKAYNYHQDDDPKVAFKPLVQWLYENNYNNTLPSNVFELPLNLLDCVTALGSCVYPQSVQSANKKNPLLFNFSAQGITLEAARNEKYGQLFSPYVPLINALYCIQQNDLNKALDVIDIAYSMKRSRFGFHSYAFPMLYIGLKYKLSKIQHNKLEGLISDLNSNIGINNLLLVGSSAIGRIVSEENYHKYSIYSPTSPTFHFNLTLILALSTYNLAAIKLDASRYCHENKVTELPSLMCFAKHAPQPNRDILAKLERVAGKLLAGLTHLTHITEPQLFIDTILEKKILTINELNDNLIKHVKGSTLSVCLLDVENLVAHLSLPDGKHESIIILGKYKSIVKLLFDAMHQKNI